MEPTSSHRQELGKPEVATASKASPSRQLTSREGRFPLLFGAIALAVSLATLLTIWFGGWSPVVTGQGRSSQWHMPGLGEMRTNGWEPAGGELELPAYYLDDDRVYLRGSLAPVYGRIPRESSVFVLPPRLCPQREMAFLVPVDLGSGVLRIYPSGAVIAFLATESPKRVSLDGVSYRLK